MPKTDLHVHLDGSVRINTLIELAKKQNVDLPSNSPESLKKILVPGINCKSLADYLRPFDIVLSVLQDEESLYRVAFELAEDAASENVWYMEIRYSPILHTKRGMKLPMIVDAVLAGLKEAEKNTK